MSLIMDRSGTAAAPDAATFASWAGDQRVFISSVMGDLAALRQELAAGITDMGAHPVWFEDFGGRDDDAEVAYLGEVASSSIYLGVLARHYGARDRRTRLSATHAEYREAEKLGLPVSVWVRDTKEMNADQYEFLSEVRTFHTTGSFNDGEDLLTRVRRRFQEMAAEAVSPWVKLGQVVLRARSVTDNGTTITVRAAVHSPDVVAALEAMRPQTFRAQEQYLTWAGRSVPARVIEVNSTTSAARSTEMDIVLERLDSSGNSAQSFLMGSSVTTNGRTFTSEELAVLDVRHVLFGEEKPPGLFGFGGSLDEVVEDLPAENLPTAAYQAVFSLVVTEALVKSGLAQRVGRAQVSPSGPEGRRVRLTWTGRPAGGRQPEAVSVDGVLARA